MKQIIVLICLFTGWAAGLQAQKAGTKTRSKPAGIDQTSPYSASIAPASFVWSTLDLALERRLAERTSLLAQGQFGFRKIQLWEALGGNYFSYGGRLECRGYIGKNARVQNGSLQGPYFAGWIKASTAQVNATLQQKDYTMVKSQTLVPGLGVGWKFPLSRKWPNVTIDLLVGGGYRFGNVNGRYAEQSRSILFKDRGLAPAFGFRVGYTPPVSAKSGAAARARQEAPEAITFHDRYSRKKRKSIEKVLVRNGLNPGKVDGRFDDKTIQAIKQFQRKNGLSADGKAGDATLLKMKLEKN